MGEGLLDLNPVIGTNRQEETSRDRVLSDDELKIIWNATADGSDYSSIVRLLLLTGCRATEIGSLSFSEISDNQITLPPKRTKNGRQHIIPIVPAVQDILNARPRGDGFVSADADLRAGASTSERSISVSPTAVVSSRIGLFMTCGDRPPPKWPKWASRRTSLRQFSTTSVVIRPV